MKFRTLNIIIYFLATLWSQAQVFPEKGVPLINNFSPSQYLNSGKVWSISNSPNGLVYMASDNGLLECDGASWNVFKGSKGITRSVLVVSDSIIYTGSDLDFGVWTKSRYDNIKYKSLYPFKDVVQDVFEEFWHIFQLNEMVIFVSSQNIYLYKNEQVTKIKAQINISESFIFNDTIYFVDKQSGLYYFDNLSLKQLVKTTDEINFIGLYKKDDKSIFVSKNSGLYSFDGKNISPLNNNLSNVLKDAKVFSYERIDSTHLAFGTILKGLIITDTEGNIIHIINKVKGLLSNTILSLKYTKSGKLWIGMDYGISSLFLHNNITYFYDYLGNFGTASSAILINNEFYFGTNQGLYHSAWDDLDDNSEFSNFNLIPGTEGQVWTLLNYDNQLFIGHDHGLFMLNKNEFIAINKQEGVWSIIPYKDYLITGTYNGISIYKNYNNKWNFYKKMDLISGSCNQLILQNEHTLWINIPNYGVIKAELDTNLNLIKRTIFAIDSFACSSLYLSQYQDKIQITTSDSHYIFNIQKDKFEVSKHTLLSAKPENILPEVYESIPLNNNYSFLPIYNGFALVYKINEIDSKQPKINIPIIRDIKAYNNNQKQMIYYGSEVPYKLNNIRIEYIVPNQEDVLYQYRLRAEDNWSNWSSEHIAEFVGINYGDYHLQVRAKVASTISAPYDLVFTISKPWLLSWKAYLLYFLIFDIFVVIIILRQKHLVKKEKEKMLVIEQNSIRELTEKHNETINKLEQERIQKEYEQLKYQLRTKTIQLASKAKESEDKNRLLITIQEKFVEMQDKPATSKTTLNEIRRLLNSYINVEDRTFEIQMDELHQEFFKKIKEQFPNLSNNDLRLCAYIKVGINAKEIAEILNIQPSSAYISRSRLRKKLNLDSEEDLYDFLNKY